MCFPLVRNIGSGDFREKVRQMLQRFVGAALSQNPWLYGAAAGRRKPSPTPSARRSRILDLPLNGRRWSMPGPFMNDRIRLRKFFEVRSENDLGNRMGHQS